MVTNVLFVGVGGQGTLLASRILGHVLLEMGHDVKLSEVHGMSQRGGSVTTYVRFGDKVHSPLIEDGEGDVVVAFEQLEGLRALPSLKIGGRMIVNTQRIDPLPVVTGDAAYPEGIVARLTAAGADVQPLDALSLALQAGSAKAVNVVLLGCLAHALSLSPEAFLAAVDAVVPPKFVALNRAAFEAGYAAAKSA